MGGKGNMRYLASFDETLVEVTPKNASAAVEAANQLFASGEIEGVNIKGFVSQSLEPLRKLRSVKRVHLQRCQKVDLEPLYGQSKLESLVISPDPLPVDLSRLPTLREISLVWHPKTIGLSSLRRLEKVSLWKLGDEFRDIASLRLDATVRELTLTQAKLTSISGVEKLTRLAELQLDYLRGTVDLSAISKARKLTSLGLGNAPKHRNLEAVGKCASLERLHLENCGVIESIDWLRGMTKLRQFVLLGTKVADRDFSVLAKLPKLKTFSADYRRDYKPPIKELESMLSAQVIV